MEMTGNQTIELMNCLSWVILTIALIVAMFYMVKSHIEVKIAIKKKIEAETEKIKNGDYNTRKY